MEAPSHSNRWRQEISGSLSYGPGASHKLVLIWLPESAIGIGVKLSHPGPLGVTQRGRKVYRPIEERAFPCGMVSAH